MIKDPYVPAKVQYQYSDEYNNKRGAEKINSLNWKSSIDATDKGLTGFESSKGIFDKDNIYWEKKFWKLSQKFIPRKV